MSNKELNEKLQNVNDIQQAEINFSGELFKQVQDELDNETKNLQDLDKEKEVMKNGIMNKIFYAIFGKMLKRLKFGCYVKLDDKIIWNYEFPNK